ncbi:MULTISPECIES: hypothetical protein [unclassified Polaromonas]|jgi:hypothetical protein|uniref:hypothetical protein n=1 Tax=unclassified Polaromonas TaxID=2638319 RepID=UPI0025E49CDD|nr:MULTISPECIES: hypothetical protein [unclassified Polaromonas]
MLTIYNYHPETGEFIGATLADASPLEPEVPLIPANATPTAPPSAGQHQVAVFEAGAWTLTADHRGQTYWLDGQRYLIEDLGVTPPEGSTAEKPPVPLAEEQVAAQARIDAHYQVLFDQAVANNAIKAEYDAAYMVAKRWLENQGEPAPERVKALAESYGVTNVQAAGVVVQKWTEAQAVAFDLRGAARLRAKLAIRQAVDLEGVAAAEAAGRAAMEAVEYSV